MMLFHILQACSLLWCMIGTKVVATTSPYNDGYLLDSTVKVSQFLWMKTKFFDKNIRVNDLNKSHEFSVLLNLEGHSVPPFIGNFSSKETEFAKIRINSETSTQLVLSESYPWRKVLVYLEIRKGEFLNCDLDFRLHSNKTYNFLIQGYFHEYETLMFVFMNGKMLRKCTYSGESFQRSEVAKANNLLQYTLENKENRVITHNRVVYWPRVLSYHEVQQVSLATDTSDTTADSTLSMVPISSNTWYQNALNQYPGSKKTENCIDENIAVVVFPGFYFGRTTNKVPSVKWMKEHLLQSLQSVLHTITLCNGGSVVIYVPLSSQHRQYVEDFIMKGLQISIVTGVSLEFFTIPDMVKPISSKNLTVTYSFGSVINSVLEEIKSSLSCEIVDYVAVLASHIYPEKNWLEGLIDGGLSDGSADIVGGKIVHMNGVLLHYGYELLELSFNGGLDVMLTPHNMYRGYWATDKRTHSHEQALAVSKDMMIFKKSILLNKVVNSPYGLFDETMSPMFEDVDLCLRAKEQGLVVNIAGEAVGTSTKALYMYDEDEISHLTSSLFNPLHMKLSVLQAFQAFSKRWKEKHQLERERNFLTPAKLTWVIHCGGSQGLEAATILQTLYKYLDVRTLIRRYSFCEHSDTLSGMPAYFNDILDYTAYRSFTKPYQGFSKLSRTLANVQNEKLNQTITTELTGEGVAMNAMNSDGNVVSTYIPDGMVEEDDFSEDGSIVLYARDYREMGRWIPRDTSYIIGRYMYETDSLPKPWANHCNQLDEVWVPSQWQLKAFENGGVMSEKMQIMGETVDEFFFDPFAVDPLALPGTKLDGYPPPPPRYDPETISEQEQSQSKNKDVHEPETTRPFAFCAVFKMEDRKGYKELVEGYMREFHNRSDVVLVLRTYIHSGQGISDENFSPFLIRKEIDDHLSWRNLPLSRRANVTNSTRIEIVSEHLPTKELVSLYASCDAFVLSTHAEGWGLPTHEAMIMGLPVITTNFGGSTEFVTEESGLLIDVDSLIPTSGDDWLRGGNWASINISSLQEQMRKVYNDRSLAKTIGQKGKKFVEKFAPDAVARSYVNRIATIYDDILPSMPKRGYSDSGGVSSRKVSRRSPRSVSDRHSLSKSIAMSEDSMSHGEKVAENLDIQFGQTGRFKTCSVRSYKRNRLRRYPSHVSVTGADTNGKNTVVGKTAATTTSPVCDYVIISTWSPRLCGIATFSSALRNALLATCPPGSRVDVVAVKHKDQPSHEYNNTEVKKTFSESEPMSYVSAAQFINNNQYQTALIQYEFGMLYGDHLTCFMRELKTPKVFTTIHTVKINYQDNLQAWVQQASFMSDRLVVMTHSMRHILNSFLAIPTRDVAVIPHGGPNLPYDRLDGTDQQSFFAGKKVILSNGLIHPMKGLELMIWAMKQVLEVVPDAVYLIHGTPHPSGVGCKEYYEYIQDEANKTAPNHIFFNNSFASTADLHKMLRSASVYVNAYTDREQSVSGTLAMALGLGTVAVSTPYAYAAEVLQNNSGRLVPFDDVDALAEAVIDVLSDDANRKVMSRSAFAKAQEQKWDNIAEAYIQLANN